MYSWERKLIDEAQKYGYLEEGVAETILQQLGGRKFLVMTGARGLLKSDAEKWLSFKLPGSYKGVNYVKITLTSSDLYDVEFGFVRGTSYSVKKQAKGIYADQLQKLFTDTTGLYTHL